MIVTNLKWTIGINNTEYSVNIIPILNIPTKHVQIMSQYIAEI